MHQLQEINDRWKGTLIETLGIRLTKSSIVKGEKLEITPDTPISFEAEMLVTPAVSQPFGILHGGASLALAETIAGYASMILCEENEVPCGIQVSANHVHSAKIGDTVKALATLVHKGRSTHVWNVEVTSVETGRTISSVRVTNYIKEG